MRSKPKMIAAIGEQLSFPKGKCIFQEGETGQEMYVIISGRVRIFISTDEGTMTLATLRKSDFFGEMALLEDLPRSASAEALEDVELIALGTEDFKFLIQQQPEIAMRVLGKFSSRLRDTDHIIELLLISDEAGKVIAKLVKHAVLKYGAKKKVPKKCFLPITPKELAKETELSLEQLVKTMGDLQRIGLATLQDDGVVLYKHKKLKYYLEYLDWKLKSG